MEIKNNRTIHKITTIYTSDLELIENNNCDVYPYAIWVDKQQAEEQQDIATFLEDYPQELELLKNGDIDYIVVEYDM